LSGGENREKGWTGMVHLPGEMRGKPGTERSFFAGETERNFVFAITKGDTRKSFIMALEILSRASDQTTEFPLYLDKSLWYIYWKKDEAHESSFLRRKT
jgi:L-asparaginase II